MNEVKFQISRVYDEMIDGLDEGKDTFVLEGGARSTKTSSIIQVIDTKIMEAEADERSLEILVLRETAKECKLVTLKDFFKINKLYDVPVTPEMKIGRAIQMYYVGNSSILFEGCNNYEEFLGSEFDIIWINEAMPVAYNVYRSLKDRCRDLMILDYNPNRTEHWIYDKVIPSPYTKFIHSTQLDNPFLHPTIRRNILSSEPTPENIEAGTADETHWKIYGLGQRAQVHGLIYTNVNYVDEFPKDCKWSCYSLDFGFTQSPTAITREGFKDGEIWRDEIVYEVGLTNLPPIRNGVLDMTHTKNINYKLIEAGVNKHDEIYADSAEQKSIQELRDAGWNVIAVKKPSGSVNEGIGICQRYKHNVTHQSQNIKREYSNYKWMDNPTNPNWTEDDNRNKNKPVKSFDHSMDGLRYVALVKLKGVGLRSTVAKVYKLE